jgi:hypothetical protein
LIGKTKNDELNEKNKKTIPNKININKKNKNQILNIRKIIESKIENICKNKANPNKHLKHNQILNNSQTMKS